MNSYNSAGRKTLILVISILLIDTVFYYLTDNTLTPGAKLLRFSLTVLLMVFIFRGHGWAKWLTGILLVLNSLLCVLRVFFVFPNLWETLYSLLYIVLYGSVGYILLTSKNISNFMQYKKSRR